MFGILCKTQNIRGGIIDDISRTSHCDEVNVQIIKQGETKYFIMKMDKREIWIPLERLEEFLSDVFIK